MRLFAESEQSTSPSDNGKRRTDEFAIVNDGIVPGITGAMYAASLGIMTAESSGIVQNVGQVWGGLILGAFTVAATALQLQSGNLVAIKNKGISLAAVFFLTTGAIKDADAATPDAEKIQPTPSHFNITTPTPYPQAALTHPSTSPPLQTPDSPRL